MHSQHSIGIGNHCYNLGTTTPKMHCSSSSSSILPTTPKMHWTSFIQPSSLPLSSLFWDEQRWELVGRGECSPQGEAAAKKSPWWCRRQIPKLGDNWVIEWVKKKKKKAILILTRQSHQLNPQNCLHLFVCLFDFYPALFCVITDIKLSQIMALRCLLGTSVLCHNEV